MSEETPTTTTPETTTTTPETTPPEATPAAPAAEAPAEAPAATATEAAASPEAGATAEGESPAASGESFSEVVASTEFSYPTVRELLEAGVHFGHQTSRWDARMKPYLFGNRSGVHIIDLDQTRVLFEDALDFIRDVTAKGGKILFVGTKRQAQAPILAEATRAGQFYVNQRWLGGMLTNFKTVKNSVERFKKYLEILADPEKLGEFTKREGARIQREANKLEKSLGGIKEMTKLPDAVFVIGVDVETIGIKEAKRLGIPVIGVVDSNCNPDLVDMVVPGNDDATRAIALYCSRMADACIDGGAKHQAKLAKEGAGAPARAGKQAGPSSGRVVVDIKPPPRRGRGGAGGASAGGEKRGGKGKGKGKPEKDVSIANPMAPRRRKKVVKEAEGTSADPTEAEATEEAPVVTEAVETTAAPTVTEAAAVTEAVAPTAAPTEAAPAEAPAEEAAAPEAPAEETAAAEAPAEEAAEDKKE